VVRQHLPHPSGLTHSIAVHLGGRSLSALFGPFQAGANVITKLLEHCRP
jgi:hypothetical protein